MIMTRQDKTPQHIKIDEKRHVEEPLLEQLTELGWDVRRAPDKQVPSDTQRESFTEVLLLVELKKSLKKINPWIEDVQIEEVIRKITNFSRQDLLENNRQILNLLLENTTVHENRKTNERSPTVKYIDFETTSNNSFVAISQFKVRILGTEHHIIPDIVIFINGIPVSVIECKSPKVQEPIPEAIDQLMRYCEQRGEEKEGSKNLFYYNQFIIATSRQSAKFGTITTNNEKHFYSWRDPFPRKLEELDHGNSSPNDQQRLVAGMLDKNNILSIIRTFTIFGTNDKGKMIKIVGRYQQYRAVKLAVKKLLDGKNRSDRSGIIWHTQGSGKSLTMMFMVREMYRHPDLNHWKVIFVTDRDQLEQQLSETSQSIGYTVKVADSIKKLKTLLPGDSSDLIMAMIHKFQERDLSELFPELNPSPHILIMIDEAHRTQYNLLGANLDRAIPNAAKIGYTGTPIDKTEQVFGDYIDKYTMRQAIDDGVTLEIVYEGKTHNAEVADATGMDTMFADVFSDYRIDERLQILGYASKMAYLEAESTIAAKAKDMVAHYLSHVFPNGFKAQVVASSQEAAVRYDTSINKALNEAILELEKANPRKIDIAKLKKLKTGIIVSGGHNSLPHIKAHSDSEKHKNLIKSFKLSFDAQDEGITGDVGILIVMNMLITGFDAPIEQVMYLDRVIVAHNLLQAIARVNRVGDPAKEKGLLVDYVGVGHHLTRALQDYDEREKNEIISCMTNESEELTKLKVNFESVVSLLKKHGLSDYTDHDAFYDLFYDEDIRFEYILAFKKLTQSMNSVFPRKEALNYWQSYQNLTEINALASSHFNDQRLSMKGIPSKLRTVADAHLKSKGIDVKVKPISILDPLFEGEVGKKKRAKTKAAEVEHAIRRHIDVNVSDDPELYASFAEALKNILKDFKDNWDKIYEELEKLRKKMKNTPPPPGGLHKKKQMPFFRVFSSEIYGKKYGEDQTPLAPNEEDAMVYLTKEIFEIIHREIQLTGFWQSIPARNKLKAEIQDILLSEQFRDLPNVRQNRNQIISRIMEIAETNSDAILYAE